VTVLNFVCSTEQQTFTDASEGIARLRFPCWNFRLQLYFPGCSAQDLFTCFSGDQRLCVQLIYR